MKKFSTLIILIVCTLAAGFGAITVLSTQDFDIDTGVLGTVYETRTNLETLMRGTRENETPFVHVDLDGMEVTYSKGETSRVFRIVQHGDDVDSGSMVQEGVYTVDKKEPVVISTISMSRFPYYVQFADGYALHGIPTGKDEGTASDVPVTGNSITLSLDDAQTLYQLTEEGMMVYVTASTKNDEKNVEHLTLSSDTLPVTSALAYVVSDMETGDVLLSKGADDRYPIASITKLMTAVVATDVVGHGTTITISGKGNFTISDLFYPLLLRSDNVVANRIARYAGEEYFLSNMNAYARSIGMMKSAFADASGLSPRNSSTANDLSVLARHLYAEKTYLLAITKEDMMTITSSEGILWHTENQNMLADDPLFRGGKLGYTDEAGQTSLAIFDVPVGGSTRPIAVVVLHSKDWKQDTRTLLRWIMESDV